MKKYIFSLFSLLVLNSCEDVFTKEITPPKEATEKKCVVMSYLSPNLIPAVGLQWSHPILESNRNELLVIDNAEPILLNKTTGEITPLHFDRNKQIYLRNNQNFKIEEENTYELQIKIPNHEDITAECTIPPQLKADIKNIELIPSMVDGSRHFEVSFEFKDTARKDRNYYLASVRAYGRGVREVLSVSPFTNLNREGKNIVVHSEKVQGDFKKISRIVVNLLLVDKNYYEYKRTTMQQLGNVDLEAFTEPVFIVSNIHNGLGIFGAYTHVKHVEDLIENPYAKM
ncbi:DUF4249 domain-containing protein [Ornithobacterium rhinotracheale]|uniref:DUF4249 domain-containing protein n=1 Tax=Ornithobacterium rhinotracheale TaxID=28251 RepID=UPI00129C563D|nr:DUF4249 domain-containing protein [Ornithobacterium rhinotracheale]MRI63630.1 DUF4249 domain-containing protein [Ornithobacterium rhinotracheale]